MPKKAKALQKPRTYKRASTSKVIIARLGPRMVRSYPTPIDIPFNPMVDESSLRPIDLYEDIMGP